MNIRNNDVVLSSRIRLARNVDGYVFPSKLSIGDSSKIAQEVFKGIAGAGKYNLYRMSDISNIEGGVLKEKHLVSDDLLHSKDTGAVIINEFETVSIMLGEEDHIREQCILPGLSLSEAYSVITNVDDLISKKLPFSYSEKLGYLTACPTNLGTGMRASAMMFLPGLSIYNSLEACVSALSRLNMTIRGVYGEGSDSAGYIFQLSNQKSLGLSEQEIIGAVNASVSHILDAELQARKSLYQSSENSLKDKIMRAYGVLLNAYKIDSNEFMQLIALVKLGIYYDFIRISDNGSLEKLITLVQPSNLASISKKDLGAEERDIYRAELVSNSLKTMLKT